MCYRVLYADLQTDAYGSASFSQLGFLTDLAHLGNRTTRSPVE